MAPQSPKLAGKAASEVRFATWDEMVAEATVDLPPYEVPFGGDDVMTIPVPDGERYLLLVAAQRRGDAVGILDNLVPDKKDRERLKVKMRGVHFPIIDTLAGKVLSYYFGLGTGVEAESGNSPAS